MTHRETLSNKIKVIVKSSNEQKSYTYEVPRKAAEISEIFKEQMAKSKDPNKPIEINAQLDQQSMEYVVTFMEKFENAELPKIEKPLPNDELKNIISNEETFQFIDKISLEPLVKLTVVANYLGIQPILELCCAKIAYMCKDKVEEEIFKVFDVTETFTEDEMQQIREENPWIEENL